MNDRRTNVSQTDAVRFLKSGILVNFLSLLSREDRFGQWRLDVCRQLSQPAIFIGGENERSENQQKMLRKLLYLTPTCRRALSNGYFTPPFHRHSSSPQIPWQSCGSCSSSFCTSPTSQGSESSFVKHVESGPDDSTPEDEPAASTISIDRSGLYNPPGTLSNLI